MSLWLALVTRFPTANATARQRAWRALKSSGAAVLRDGIYLLPDRPAHREALEGIATEVRSGSGTAWVVRMEEPDKEEFQSLFDRSQEYASLLAENTRLLSALSNATPEIAAELLKQVRKLRKAFLTIAAIDFFPSAARQQTESALRNLELAAARAQTPGEPHDASGIPRQLAIKDYQARLWATRKRPWVDRLASAWLIRRFIDHRARFLWLENPADCPSDAIGFDFDGASFSHLGNRVTYEVLMTSFGLEQPGLLRLGAVVHYLDVGGVEAPEAAGVESILSGLRASVPDDDLLLVASLAVFDGLHAAFNHETTSA